MGFEALITDPGPELSPVQLRECELYLQVNFDMIYRDFLLRFNGGTPSKGIVAGEEVWELDFLSVLPDATGLRRAHDCLAEFVHGYFPFAMDMGERLYLMSKAESPSKVYLGIYVYEDVSVPSAVDIRPIAADFLSFIKSLQDLPGETFCQIEDMGVNGNRQTLHAFLSGGGDINTIGKNDLTAISEASKNGNSELVTACLEENATIGEALFIAVLNQRFGIVELLVASGVDLNETSDEGETLLDYVPIAEVEFRRQMRRLGAKSGEELQEE